MCCRDIQQKLDLYCGEELTSSARERLEAHLNSCDACRRELDRMRRLRELLASATTPPAPKGFAARVIARAREESDYAQNTSWQTAGGTQLVCRVRATLGVVVALTVGLLLGGFLGFDTWPSDGQSVAVGTADPLAESGLHRLVEPGGNSLAETYLALTLDNDVEER